MKNLAVTIEIDGNDVLVGRITGADTENASFSYADSYILESGNRPISLSMPLETKNFYAELLDLAREGALKSAQLVTKAHLSLTGASGKAGLYYHEREKDWYLPLGTAPSTHIVKQSHVRLKHIVTNEQAGVIAVKILDGFKRRLL